MLLYRLAVQSGSSEDWQRDFAKSSGVAAQALSPVAHYLVARHLCRLAAQRIPRPLPTIQASGEPSNADQRKGCTAAQGQPLEDLPSPRGRLQAPIPRLLPTIQASGEPSNADQRKGCTAAQGQPLEDLPSPRGRGTAIWFDCRASLSLWMARPLSPRQLPTVVEDSDVLMPLAHVGSDCAVSVAIVAEKEEAAYSEVYSGPVSGEGTGEDMPSRKHSGAAFLYSL